MGANAEDETSEWCGCVIDGVNAALSRAATVDRRLSAARGLAFEADTARILGAPIPSFIVKGPVLAATYSEPARRRCNDLDVVVRPSDLSLAINVFEDQGARLLDANWELAIRERWGQVHLRMPSGTLVDLHWHLVNKGRVRETMAVDMVDAWRDLRTVDIPGGRVWTLSVTNTVVHVALHAALGGAWRQRWFEDLRSVIAHECVNWDEVVARAVSWRVRRLTGVALARAQRLGSADVPEEVLDRLLTKRTQQSIQLLDQLWPPPSSTRDASPSRLWPSLVRDTWRDSARAAADRARRRVRNRVLDLRQTPAVPLEMIPSGNDATKARYLEMVTSWS